MTYKPAPCWWVFVKDDGFIGHWINLATIESVSYYYSPSAPPSPDRRPTGIILQWMNNRVHLSGFAAARILTEIKLMRNKYQCR